MMSYDDCNRRLLRLSSFLSVVSAAVHLAGVPLLLLDLQGEVQSPPLELLAGLGAVPPLELQGRVQGLPLAS